MLTIKLLHPEILQALASNGHGAKILIADANFPLFTQTPLPAKKVFLNLAPGLLKVTDVLGVIIDFIPVESIVLMQPPDDHIPSIHQDILSITGTEIPSLPLKRTAFYERARHTDCCLVIATGDTRRFANVILTIGVVKG